MSQSLEAYLVLAVLLFGIGAFGFLAKRNAIAMLMSIELMLNSVNLAIIAFGAFTPDFAAQASTIALFVIAVAAAEATVGLAIVIAIYRNRRTPLVDEYASMKLAAEIPRCDGLDTVGIAVEQRVRPPRHRRPHGRCLPASLWRRARAQRPSPVPFVRAARQPDRGALRLRTPCRSPVPAQQRGCSGIRSGTGY